NSIAIWSAVSGFALTVIFHKWFKEIQKWIIFFDAAGLGVFTVMGIQVGLNADMGIGISITLGTITGCFGGVIRDVLSGSRPLIFHSELYATASIIGGILYVALLTQMGVFWAQIVAIAAVIGIRMIAYHFHFTLPQFGTDPKKGFKDQYFFKVILSISLLQFLFFPFFIHPLSRRSLSQFAI